MVRKTAGSRLGERQMTMDIGGAPAPIGPGMRVEVRDHFEGGWAGGFEVVDELDGAMRLRRVSDGAEIPWWFGVGDLRAQQ